MNWISNYVRPKIQALVGKPTQPENLWDKCPACEQMLFRSDLEGNLHVCQYCNHHLRISAKARVDMLFDENQCTVMTLPSVPPDPLKFRDTKRYTDRLRDAQAKTGQQDALCVAHGRIDGEAAVVAAMDFTFMGGSMGTGVGEGIIMASRLAKTRKAPLIIVSASGGARMQEGILSLMQMPRTVIAVEEVREAGLPYIVVLADPTTGGVTASFAMLGDITIAEPGAVIGFAGPRVIEETIRQQLPDGFQRSEYLLDHGMVDLVVPRGELKSTLSRLIGMLMRPDKAEPEAPESVDEVAKEAVPDDVAPEAAEANEEAIKPE